MIMKLLLLIAVIAAVYFIFFKPKNKPVEKSSGKSGNTKAKNESDEMVECTKCGTYTSVDEALISNGKYYCSQECLNS